MNFLNIQLQIWRLWYKEWLDTSLLLSTLVNDQCDWSSSFFIILENILELEQYVIGIIVAKSAVYILHSILSND